jgi:L-alanine-DL-glutamate epimerase-like enolase superfamily enzyme
MNHLSITATSTDADWGLVTAPSLRPVALDIYHTAIPMRSFQHAAASRDLAESVVTCLHFSDGRAGWGQTLPRAYVTGETLDTVPDDLEHIHWPGLLTNWNARAGASLENFADLIADRDSAGRCLNAAACCLELAILDAVAWRQSPVPCKAIASRASGVLGSANPSKTAWSLLLMRIHNLRDFKLKLGFGDKIDEANLRVVHDRIGKHLRAGTCSLRVDVNGGWDIAGTPDRVAMLKDYNVCVVEQPAYCSAAQLVELANKCPLPLMADESLLSTDDANTLLQDKRIWWNIRISKNGGLLRAKALANLAAENQINYVVGCMVGESGLLSAAQRRLLQIIQPPKFVEGNFGRFLLADDLTTRSPRFTYGGRLRALPGPGLGVNVVAKKVLKYSRLLKTLKA